MTDWYTFGDGGLKNAGISRIMRVGVVSDCGRWVRFDDDGYLPMTLKIGVDVFKSADETKAELKRKIDRRLAGLHKQIAELQKAKAGL